MRKLIIILSGIVLFMTSSCKSSYELLLESGDTQLKYEKAFEYYNQKKYSKSASLFESLKMVTKSTPQDDTVEFYACLSHYKYRDLYTAETGLESFIRLYPLSPFYSEARFLYITCLFEATYRYELDQDPTYKAIAKISQYLVEEPDGKRTEESREMLEELQERLDIKAYRGAKIYYDMDDFKAARYAFKNLLKENSETSYREEVVFYTAMSSYYYARNSVPAKQKERYMTFVDDYFDFIGEFSESKYLKEIEPLYERINKRYNKEENGE